MQKSVAKQLQLEWVEARGKQTGQLREVDLPKGTVLNRDRGSGGHWDRKGRVQGCHKGWVWKKVKQMDGDKMKRKVYQSQHVICGTAREAAAWLVRKFSMEKMLTSHLV